jgi:energy-coupling factor transport system ATP-binding protein
MMNQQDLQCKDVYVYASGSDEHVALLKGINLRISQGEWVSIIGRNGSGKSTLAQVLTGILPVNEGDVERGFAGWDPIPYVMQQEGQLFGDTPWEDIVFLLEVRGFDPDKIPSAAVHALSRVGLSSDMHRPISALSGGQKQLAATAGCLAVNAPLLLFDEAASMLDSTSRHLVLETAKDLHNKGATVIWMTHHMEELSAGERVVALDHGQVVFDGSITSFFYGSLCETLGFELPFPVQVAKELIKSGIPLPSLPITAMQLAEAVRGRAG